MTVEDVLDELQWEPNKNFSGGLVLTLPSRPYCGTTCGAGAHRFDQSRGGCLNPALFQAYWAASVRVRTPVLHGGETYSHGTLGGFKRSAICAMVVASRPARNVSSLSVSGQCSAVSAVAAISVSI